VLEECDGAPRERDRMRYMGERGRQIAKDRVEYDAGEQQQQRILQRGQRHRSEMSTHRRRQEMDWSPGR
jgi:hypothetical protein